MKSSTITQFQEWQPFYLDYEGLKESLYPTEGGTSDASGVLKKLTKRLSVHRPQRRASDVSTGDDTDLAVCFPDGSPLAEALFGSAVRSSAALGNEFSRDAEFRQKLLEEVRKVESFFTRTLTSLEDSFSTLKTQVITFFVFADLVLAES